MKPLSFVEISSVRRSPFRCVFCKRRMGPYKMCYYLVRGESWIPFCSLSCRAQQYAEWTKKRDLRDGSQLRIFSPAEEVEFGYQVPEGIERRRR